MAAIARYNFKIYRWAAADGKPLGAKLYLPARSGTNSPVPIVVVPYGGYLNEFQDPRDFMMSGLLKLIRLGWGVVFPNTRGSASEQNRIGHYGDLQLQDTELLLRDLSQQHIIDSSRIAVFGHSHGGSLTYYYAGHSTMFCAAVAINGRADLIMQANSGDDYLIQQLGGSPEKVPDVYTKFSPIESIQSIQVPVLAVAGKLDTQILPENATSFVSKLQSIGKKAELLEFSDEGHLITRPKNIDILWQRVNSFLADSCYERSR